jgi:trimeric autotransporter adhesin
MGAVNISNTGSGAAVTLSSDGTSLLLNGTAIGGGGGSSTITISNQTAAYTVVAGDLAKVINCSGATSFTVSLTAAATLGAGFNVTIWNNSTTTAMAVTIDPAGSETIDGKTTLVVRPGEGTQIVCDGTNWQTGNKKKMRFYAENSLSTSGENRPTASGQDSIAIGTGSNSVGVRSVTLGTSYASGEDSFAAAIGNGSSLYGALGNQSVALSTNSKASGTKALAIGSNTIATPSYSTALGLNSGASASQTVTGAGAMALGGSYASGSDSFAAAVGDNTSTYGAQGANSIAIGKLAKATGSSAIAISSNSAFATGTGSIAIGGNFLGIAAGGNISVAIGDDVETTTSACVAIGYGASSAVRGKMAFSGRPITGRGLGQQATTVLGVATTDATATKLTSDGTAGLIANQISLNESTAFAFTGTVVARRQSSGGTESAAWKVEGLIRREVAVGTTTLVASLVTPISNVPLWALALSADTTYGALSITATGAASTNIRWVAAIETSEVTYA